MVEKRIFGYCLAFFFCAFARIARGQQSDSLSESKDADSLPNAGFIQLVKKLAARENVNSVRLYQEGKISIAQQNTIDKIKSVSQAVKLYMKDGLDTLDILQELEKSKRSLSIAKEGIVTNSGTLQTQRNLYVTAIILSELMDRMTLQKSRLDKFTSDLISFKDKLDSLSSDSALYTFPSDSMAIIKYARRLMVLNKEIGPIDSSLKLSVTDARELQLKVDLLVYELHSFSDDIEIYQSAIAGKLFTREVPDITEPETFNLPLREIVSLSEDKEKLVFGFYLKEHPIRVLIILLLILCALFFTRSVRKQMSEEKLLDLAHKDQQVLKYPLLSSVFVVLNLFQFIFINPPFIFSFSFACISIICLTRIVKDHLSRYWMRFWYVSILFFLLTAAENFLLQASRPERWYMLILSATGVALIFYIFFKRHLNELKERGVVYFVIFVAVTETASFFFNVYGRFNLSKALLIIGYTGIVYAILFFWTIRFINQMLVIAFRIYKFQDRRLFYINFEKVGSRVPPIFYIILVLGWFIIVGKNFYAYKLIAEPVDHFFTRTRTVGEISFTISGITIFLLVLVLSVLLSRIISFFVSSSPSPHGTAQRNRVGIGSWLLLVRIFIITMGLILAFAATGLPLDRLTIILGALSVGIGLGLQSLITNLVSGLILAFEKPVNVGDFLEINGSMAVMKSIGFRSSIVRLTNGAHVVIPNGDVLNQNLVNWSMGKNMIRLNIPVGVAYGTDLDKAKELLSNILSSNEKILKMPAPAVLVTQFGSSSINFELFFWASHILEAGILKTEVITSIDRELRKAGITIPLPQQEVHIHPAEDEKNKMAD